MLDVPYTNPSSSFTSVADAKCRASVFCFIAAMKMTQSAVHRYFVLSLP